MNVNHINIIISILHYYYLDYRLEQEQFLLFIHPVIIGYKGIIYPLRILGASMALIFRFCSILVPFRSNFIPF